MPSVFFLMITIVRVYFIGNYSKEFCGGPHVENTSETRLYFVLQRKRRLEVVFGVLKQFCLKFQILSVVCLTS